MPCRESTGRKSGVSGAPVSLCHAEYPRAQRTGHSRSVLPSPRQGESVEILTWPKRQAVVIVSFEEYLSVNARY